MISVFLYQTLFSVPNFIIINVVIHAIKLKTEPKSSQYPFLLPSNTSFIFPGLSDWNESDILAQVIAQSQQEYLDQLKSSNTKCDDMDKDPSTEQPSTSKQ